MTTRGSADETPANDAISTASAAEHSAELVESKSSLSSTRAKDATSPAHAVPMATVPHLIADDGEEVWIADAQAGAVGATWKHRVPALLMVLFFTRMFLAPSGHACPFWRMLFD